MTFRRKLLVVFSITVAFSVAAVAWLVQEVTRKAFEKNENQRTAQLVMQFQREFDRQGDDVTRRVENIAASDTVTRMAALSGTSADSAEYFDLARSLAESHQLDFLELLDSRGTIVSSAQSPARFGYTESGFQLLSGSTQKPAFLKLEQLQDTSALGLFSVRASHDPDHPAYVVGGRRLDKGFLSALNLAPEMRVLLYQNQDVNFSPDLLINAQSSEPNESRPADKLRTLVDTVRRSNQEVSGIVHWSADAADEEVFDGVPLRGVAQDRPLLGILLVGHSRRSYVELKRHIRDAAFLAVGAGIVLAIFLSSWAAARITRPIEELAGVAREVATGNWNVSVAVHGEDEIGQLATSFNQMTTELLAQKERLLQAERVAAWRELARRLAHELKNPLFPLQLTVENLVRARSQSPEQFDEVFRESSSTLLAEIANLKTIIGRFSEFSKMPQPQLHKVEVNELLRDVCQLFQAQFTSAGKPQIECRMELDEDIQPIAADPDLLHRAFSNLVLNAMDAMPAGGTLTLRSCRENSKILVSVADTGTGLTREECERIFTPYYTSKQHGTGLGLAIVQSVVSDHHGTINVQSQPGKGTTFIMEFPDNLDIPARLSEKNLPDTVEPVRR